MQYVSKDLKHRIFAGHDLSDHEIVDCDLRYSDLRRADLSRANLYMSDLRHANLSDATISLNCKTFKDVRYDDQQVDYLLYLLSIANISQEKRDGIIAVIGESRRSELGRLFGNK